MGLVKLGRIVAMTAFMLCAPLVCSAMNVETEQLARWQLNNADLLVDEGKYLQALEYINSALEISEYPKTRTDALLAKAMVQATFLDAPGQAVKTYGQLAREFPGKAEVAVYQIAFIQLQSGSRKQAKQALNDYLRRYPNGRYRFQVEAMLGTLEEKKRTPRIPVIEVSDDQPVMRVLLAKRDRAVTVKSNGAPICIDGVGCQQQVVLRPSGGYCTVNGQAYKRPSVILQSDSPLSYSSKGRGKKVRGELKIENVKGRLRVLNLVPIELYLRSVVPAESYASWPIETLKAQAIAARTYAYYQKLHRTSRAYDVRADTYDQMYGGVDREQKSTNRAVAETAGRILTYKGKAILSQYTANSGGYTADAGAVFGAPKPYLVAHEDPASLKGKMNSWKRSYSTAEIVAKLRKIGVDATGLRAIEPAVTGPSGRYVKVRLSHAKGETVLRTRTTLASSRVLKLPEVLIRIEKQGNRFVFRGKGHGHGVGYSQWGSAELGKTWNHERILAFYYPRTTLQKGWN